MDTKKQEMEDKVKSGEIPAAQAKQMQQKMAQESSNQNITVKQAQFKTLTNSGANMQASQMSSNMLKGIGDNLNKQISPPLLQKTKKLRAVSRPELHLHIQFLTAAQIIRLSFPL